MPRIEKSSRFRFLPPKVQLNLRNDFRCAPVVNRVTKDSEGQQVLVFDDTKAIEFSSGTVVNLPSGLPTNSRYLSNELTTTLVVSGNVIRHIVDEFVHRTHFESSSFAPFVDHGNPEADAIGSGNSFYATGSSLGTVGEGFNQPLWSKTKIEIDLTPSVDHAFGIQNFISNSSNFPMAYWNPVRKMYEGIGPGTEFANYVGGEIAELKSILADQCIGFGSTLDNGGVATGIVSSSNLIGNPISNFGFPSEAKYAATSSNLIPMKNFISEPFLLEKVVLFFSGSMRTNTFFQVNPVATMTTFFLMNQRSMFTTPIIQAIDYYVSSSALKTSSRTIDLGTSQRDLITWMQLSKDGSSANAIYGNGLKREWNYSKSNGTDIHFNQQLIVSGTVKSPLDYNRGVLGWIGAETAEYHEAYAVPGRNLIKERGRSWLNPIQSSELFGNATLASFWQSSLAVTVKKAYSKDNPYLLLPTDNLIIGWQLPYSHELSFRTNHDPVFTGLGPQLSSSINGINKVVLYGSLLRDGREYHESFELAKRTDVLSEDVG